MPPRKGKKKMIDTKVTGLHPKFLDAVQQTVNEAKARGLNVAIFCGLRTAEEQDAQYAKGRTTVNPDGKSDEKPMGNIVTNAKGWQSWHNYGLAVDIVFKDNKGNWTWNKTAKQWKELGVVGEIFGLEWGGRWEYKDFPHFQMKGLLKTTAEAKQVLFSSGRDALWQMI